MHIRYFALILFSGLSSILASIEYPAHIKELGDVVVTEAILDTRPVDAVILSPSPELLSRRPTFQPPVRIYSQPALNFATLEAISTYFIETSAVDLFYGNAFSTDLDIHFTGLLRFHLNHFNPSFLEGEYYSDKQVIAIGAVFLRLFKAAYPGLFRVKLTKVEIVDLCLIASGWFMSHEEENENDLDTFLAKCLKIYFPEYSTTLPLYRLNYYGIYRSGSKIVWEAAYQLAAKRIIKRCPLCLEDLNPSVGLVDFLCNREMFLKLLPLVPNLNVAELPRSKDVHILFNMIKQNIFYPESFFRPELKDARFDIYYRNYFEDFYSEALYYAIAYSNAPAVDFLLKLDHSFYEIPQNEESIDEENDSDSDWSIDTKDIPGPPPLTLENHQILRALFFSETIAEILKAVPEVFRFQFCNFSSVCLIEKFKNHFPSLMRLHEFHYRLIEEKYRDRAPSPTPRITGTKRARSTSPTIFENKHEK